MKRLFLALILCGIAIHVHAQTAGGAVTIRASDITTRANVLIGDAALQAIRVLVVGGGPATTVDGTPFGAGTTVTYPSGFRVDPSSLSVGASCATGDICIPNMGTYGNLYFSYVNPTDGTFPTFTTDATHDAPGVTSGPQAHLFYRDNLATTALVSNSDGVRQLGDGMGRSFAGGHCPPANHIDGQFTNTDGASTAVTGLGAQGADIVVEIWRVNLLNVSATNVMLDIRDGTGGAVLDSFPLSASGGAVSMSLTHPIRTSANTALAIDASVAVSTLTGSFSGCAVR